jgi:hypothetical protein
MRLSSRRIQRGNQEFDQVLEGKPGHSGREYLNAICLLRLGPAEARTLLSAVWLSAPILSGFIFCGLRSEELQAWGAADSDFQKASQMPLDDNARYVLSVNRGVLPSAGAIRDAIADLKSAIERKPNVPSLCQPGPGTDGWTSWTWPSNSCTRRPTRAGLAHLYRLRARLYLNARTGPGSP